MDLQDVKTIIKQDENSENALQSFVTKVLCVRNKNNSISINLL